MRVKFFIFIIDLKEEFKNCLEELVPSLLSPDRLIPKSIEGRKIGVAELFQFVELYVEKLNSDQVPTPRSIFDVRL